MIPIIMVIAYLIVTLSINAVCSRQNKGTKEYFVAHGGMGLALVIALIFSEVISGTTTVGAATTAFNAGISSVWSNWGQGIGMIICVLFLGKFYRAMGRTRDVMSVPSAFAYMFDNRCRIVMLLITIVSYGIIFAATVTAAANIIAPLFGTSYAATYWVVGIIFIFVTCVGGIKGIAAMNILNTAVIFFVLLIVALMILNRAGGWSVLTSTLPATYFDLFQPDAGTALAGGLGTAIGCLIASVYANVLFSAKTYKVAKRGLVITCILLFVFSLFPAIIGLSAKVIMPDADASTILYTAGGLFGQGWSGAVAMAVVAASISTGPAFLLFVCVAMVKDFYCLIKPAATDKQQMHFSWLSAIIIGVVFMFLGQNASSVLGQVQGAFQIRSIVGIVLLVAVYWPKTTTRAAFWAMIIGGVLASFWFFADSPLGIAPLWAGAIVTLIVQVVITLFSREKVSPGYLRYRGVLEEFKVLNEKELEEERAAKQARR